MIGSWRSWALDALSAADVTDNLLHEAWTALTTLHDQGIAHRQITASRIAVDADGRLAWADLGAARLAPSSTDMMLDRVHLLVTTWLLAGVDRAVKAAAAVLGRDGRADTMPYCRILR